MSHADPGPLATYNSLQDKHLSGYFSNSRMKRHLRRSGLVTKSGKIIDERTYRLNMVKKEHRKHVRDLLATAIVHKTLDMERMRQYEIRKRLDEVYKIELVKRVKPGDHGRKEDRKRKGDEDILPLLSPRERTARQMHKAKQSNGDQQRPATAPSTYADYRAEEDTPLKPSELVYDQDMGKIVYRTNPSTSQSGNGYLQDETEELGPSPYTRAYSSTYPAPAPPQSGTPQHARRHSTPRRGVRLRRFHYLAKTEPAVAHRIQLQSMAEVTMKFLGPSLVLTNSMFPEDRLSDVMVLQQHCGGSTLCVFRELLPANTIFTFISRRHRGAPFGLTFYIDGLQDIRLSSCCEYKHKPGHVLGGKNGHFQFVVVEGAAPCYRCQVASSYSKNTKRKHKTSQQEGEEDQNPKAFLTETANDEEEAGETFDIIITKINPPKSEDDESKDAGEMVDDSTQTPRDDDANKESKKEGEKIETISSEEASFEVTPDETEKGGAADEPGAGEYEDDDFEKDEEKEKEENTSDGDTKEESENEEQETREKSEYKEDFESEDEKEEEEFEVEEEKETGNKEESEGEIQDETEEVQEKSTVNEKEEEDPKEVYDETEEKMADSSDRPSSATDNEDKLSKNVSFDEEVAVIEDEKEKAAKTTEDVPEEEGAEDDKDKPEDELERNEAASDSRVEAEEVPEEQEEPRLEDQEVSKEEEEASEHPQEPLEETQDEIKQFEELILSREPDNSSSSSESSESSESSRSSEDSDNEDEENKMKKRKKKHKTKPSHDPGSDPDLVSTGKLPDQALKAVGVQPGAKHEGSVQSLLEGKKDVDLAGVSLTRKQLEEVASIVLARDYVGSVVLRNTGVDDHSVQRLCTAVKNAPTTKMLNLSLNQIGPAGARHIADVIRENKALRMLLLHGNPLTDEGVQIIVDAILETPNISLLNLDLGDCGISDDGAKSISQLIENNRTISQLTVSGNNIGHYGWQSIGEALKANSTLGTLSLDFNKIGDREAAIIAEGLRECKSLRCVDLEGNKIGDDGGRKLLEAVKANKSVIDLTLMPVNHISKDILDELKEVLEERVRKGSEAEGDEERNDIRRSVQEGDAGAEQKDEAGQAREDAVQGNQEHEEQTEGEEMGPGTKESTEVPVQGYQQLKEQTEGEEMDPGTKGSAEVPLQGYRQHKEQTEGEERDPGTKGSAEVPVHGNHHDEEQTEGEELDPGPIDSAEVPTVEEFKKDKQEEVNRENDAVSEDVVVGEDSDRHGEDNNKAEEEEQPSGPGKDKQEKQENMPDNPGNVPHTEETESGPQPNETEQIPPESVVEPPDTRQNPPESVPQSSVEGISRQSEAGQNPSEDFQQPSGTEQEWRLGQNVLEEGKDDYASQDSALPKDKEATHERPTEVGESSSNEIEVDKGAQGKTSLGDESERITTTLTEQT